MSCARIKDDAFSGVAPECLVYRYTIAGSDFRGADRLSPSTKCVDADTQIVFQAAPAGDFAVTICSNKMFWRYAVRICSAAGALERSHAEILT